MNYKDLEDKGVTLERTLRGEAGKIRSSFLYIFKERGVYCSISPDICDGKKSLFWKYKVIIKVYAST